MGKRFDHPRMRMDNIYDREQILEEMKDAPVMLAFYQTKKGESRCVFTDLCVPMFIFLIVVISRNIPIYEFIKKLIETVEKTREDCPDVEKAVRHAVEYLNLKN